MAYANVSKSTILNAIKTKCLVASVKSRGRKILIKRNEVDAWIERNFEPPTEKTKTVIEKPPESLQPFEAAFKIGVSESYMYKLLNTGEIPFFTENNCKRIRTDDLAQWLDAEEQ